MALFAALGAVAKQFIAGKAARILGKKVLPKVGGVVAGAATGRVAAGVAGAAVGAAVARGAGKKKRRRRRSVTLTKRELRLIQEAEFHFGKTSGTTRYVKHRVASRLLSAL